MSVSLAPGIIVNPEVKLLIDEYGTAKVTIEGSEKLSFGGGIGQEHSILSEFTANISDRTINGEGDFTYTSKVDLPAGAQLPPEYQNLASGMNLLGVVSLSGTVENDRFDGQIELSSEGGTQSADWSATRR